MDAIIGTRRLEITKWQMTSYMILKKHVYLCVLQQVLLASMSFEHSLHGLALGGHTYATSSYVGLYSDERLHAPQRHRRLLPHLAASDYSLKPHYSFQCLQSSSGLNFHSMNTVESTSNLKACNLKITRKKNDLYVTRKARKAV